MPKETPLPSQMTLVAHIAKAFGNRSVLSRQFNAMITAANNILAEMNRPYRPAAPGMGLSAWLASDDVGLSAKWLISFLNGHGHQHPEVQHPRDAADFARCVKMLDAVGLRGKLAASLTAPEPWESLLAVWPELEGLLLAKDHERLNARIRELTTGKPTPATA